MTTKHATRGWKPQTAWGLHPTRKLYIDIETYSTVDLRKFGVYPYSEDPEFLILMAAWALDDGPVEVAIGREAINAIPHLWDVTTTKVAHNAQFERVCFSRHSGFQAGRRSVGDFLDPVAWHDTAAVAGELGFPQGLDALAKALGVEQKDGAGSALIRWFCVPDRNGNRRKPEDHPEKWAQFVEYCRQDVVVLREVDRKLGDFPTEMERRVYLVDQKINDRGMAMDRELAEAAVEAAADNRMHQELEFSSITGVANPGSRDQVLAWLTRRQAEEDKASAADYPGAKQFDLSGDLRAETVEKLLKGDLPDDVRRALELRQDLALVASKKFETALGAVSPDNRLRGGFRFFGAHTGRWAGRGVQPHNMPREQFETEAETEAAIVDLKLGLGASARDLKALVRPLFTGPLTVVDYSAIEARVIAWLADEEWALDAFRKGRDIYVETAGRMGPDFTRSSGKIAVLALGYNGGPNSLQIMAAAYGMRFSDEEALRLVYAWREANPAIVELWRQMGEAFRSGGPVGELVEVEVHGTSRALRLPSGRAIWYHNVKHTFETDQFGRRKLSASFTDPRKGWRTRTYGGRLVENITQAVARDVLAEALVRLDDAGVRVVGHVHDEILTEGRSLKRVSRIMTQSPAWAEGLPIDGAGFVCRRYRKD